MGDIRQELMALRLRKDLAALRAHGGSGEGSQRLPGSVADRWREPDTVDSEGRTVAGESKRLSVGEDLTADALDLLGGGVRGLASMGGLVVDAATFAGPGAGIRRAAKGSALPATEAAGEWANRRINESQANAGLDEGALELREGRSEALRMVGETVLDPSVAVGGSRVARAGSNADEIAKVFARRIAEATDPAAKQAIEAEMRDAVQAASSAPARDVAVVQQDGPAGASDSPVAGQSGKRDRNIVSRALNDQRWSQAGTTTLRETPSGAEAATKLHEVEAMADGAAARPLRSLETLPKWDIEKRRQLGAILDGRLDPAQADPEVARMASEQRGFLDQVASAAESVGVQLQTPDGRMVPFGRREDYFPHWRRSEDGKSVFRAESVADPDGTRIGSLQHTRTGGTGDFLDDPLDVLPAYFENAWRRIAETRHFGSDIGAAVDDFAKRAAAEGADEGTVREILSGALGGGVRSNSEMTGLARDVMNFQVGTKLVTSVLSNATQTANTVAAAGFRNSARAIYDVGKWMATKDDEIIRAALDSGATVEAFKRHLVQGREDALSASFANFVLKNTGFNFVEKVNRLVAAQAGILQVDQLVRMAERGSPVARRKLDELGIDGAEAVRGGLSLQQRARAGFEMSHRTQFGLRPEDLPPGWSGSPAAKVLLQFKGFGFKQAKFMQDELLRPAMRPGPERDFGPLARYLVAGGVLYGSADVARDALYARLGDEPPHVVRQFAEGAGLAAMSGLWGQALGAQRYGIRGGAEFVLGPTGSDIWRQIDTLKEATVGAAAVGLKSGAEAGVRHAREAWIDDLEGTVSGTRAVTNRLKNARARIEASETARRKALQ